ncbi:hypothetical protein PIB30_016844 [Stylosanthes scabra]|uniref:Ubiquitin-like protease family profile domain-containing protein n=1 Tax=Stylosanthes scabra TaxID=79078 RepID=A0ABU6T789_9FABA|nr:hypothetical protein [Stylosanthes scabra]
MDDCNFYFPIIEQDGIESNVDSASTDLLPLPVREEGLIIEGQHAQEGVHILLEDSSCGKTPLKEGNNNQENVVVLDPEDDEQTPGEIVPHGVSHAALVVPDSNENESPIRNTIDDIIRKLFRLTPPASNQHPKRVRMEEDDGGSSGQSGKVQRRGAPGKPKKQQKFRRSPSMDFNHREAALFNYNFSDILQEGEDLIKIGRTEATRSDLHSLCPWNCVQEKIIELVALNITGMKKLDQDPKIWCLPPSIVTDISSEKPTECIAKKYKEPWMKPSDKLKYIYVPIEDPLGHWYLMIVAVKDGFIYHLDSSPNVYDVPDHQSVITKIAEVLSKVVNVVYSDAKDKFRSYDFSDFALRDVKGVPNCEKSLNSGVWVISWLNMQDEFNPYQPLPGIIQENQIRGRTAVDLTNSPYNELRRHISDHAATFSGKSPR